jgi:phosphoglycolate phosphatase
MVGEGAATLVTRVFAAAHLDKPPDALGRFLAIYDTKLLNHTRPYEGMATAVETLASRAQVAVLTNKPIEATRRILDGLNLAKYFAADAVLGGDGPLPRKPDPGGLHALCHRANVAPADAVLVGDSLVDWQTALQAGTGICLARYGFGFWEFPQEKLNGAERVIDSPRDLLTLV